MILTSFDAIRQQLQDLPEPDSASIEACWLREIRLTKPRRALGRLEELSAWLAGWQRRQPPHLDDMRALVFAGSHGVTRRGISAFPPEVTGQMVANFNAGKAAINQLCTLAGAQLEIVPIRVDEPTQDFCTGPAMSEDECVEAFAAGFDTVSTKQSDLLILGEMGIGNTTTAAAIGAALFDETGMDWAGPGTGLDDVGVAHKAGVVDLALEYHRHALGDPLEVLRRLGGREIAALSGAILGARRTNTPVLLDGFVVTAAATLLHALNPHALDHCQAAHVSAEPAHRQLLDHLKLKPLLDLDMRLGEGSGAAVAALILKAAVACHTGMATFEEAAVSQ
ncbi:MAG: nicotinate-nucleotide--dimethylbenzimidazole phosphoribosyltransferase [Pseudomonadota bacterium]